MYQSKFAVTYVVGNDETILCYFDNKAEAIDFGEKEKSHLINGGVLTCIQAEFDDKGNMKDNTCLVYEVWE